MKQATVKPDTLVARPAATPPSAAAAKAPPAPARKAVVADKAWPDLATRVSLIHASSVTPADPIEPPRHLRPNRKSRR
jgi:hypothetical protein